MNRNLVAPILLLATFGWIRMRLCVDHGWSRPRLGVFGMWVGSRIFSVQRAGGCPRGQAECLALPWTERAFKTCSSKCWCDMMASNKNKKGTDSNQKLYFDRLPSLCLQLWKQEFLRRKSSLGLETGPLGSVTSLARPDRPGVDGSWLRRLALSTRRYTNGFDT